MQLLFCADAVRTYASASLSASFRLRQFILFEFGTGLVRVNRGSGFLGGGEVYSAGEVKEGYGFQKPRAFWSAV